MADHRLVAEGGTIGTARLLDIDTATFGFPVAEASFAPEVRDSGCMRDALQSFAGEHGVELVSARLPANAITAIAALQGAGFRYVDSRSIMVLRDLDPHRLPKATLAIRPALPQDWAELERIAGESFDDGRYVSDPRFPRALANLRYRKMMRQDLEAPGRRVWAVGPAGTPKAFLSAEPVEMECEIRLAAAAKEAKGQGCGFGLVVASFHALAELGIRVLTVQTAPANTRMANIFLSLGFRLSDPQITLHWHAPVAHHLLPAF